MKDPLTILKQSWIDTINEIFFTSKDTKDAISNQEITEEQKFQLTFNSKEIANFVFGENDYLGYRNPQAGFTDADTPGAIFLNILNNEINPLLEKFPDLKDLTEKKVNQVKKVIREIQPIK